MKKAFAIAAWAPVVAWDWSSLGQVLVVKLFFLYLLVLGLNALILQGACHLCGETPPELGKAARSTFLIHLLSFGAFFGLEVVLGGLGTVVAIPACLLIAGVVYGWSLNVGLGKGLVIAVVMVVATVVLGFVLWLAMKTLLAGVMADVLKCIREW